jgi:membrane associated rhomboid family serine protease
MIPIGDINPDPRRSFPIVTVALIAANVAVFLWQQSLGTGFNQAVMAYGAVPYEITSGQDINVPGPTPIHLTLLTSMFMHANWMHLGGNMLFLWIFGDNLEDRMGKVKYVAFYLLCGLIASAAQIMLNPNGRIPGIGASGAIAGVMGGYLLIYPHARVRTIGRFGMQEVPAWLMLGFWILTQMLAGWADWGGRELGEERGGVAYAAHVGGFVAGLLLVKLFASRRREDESGVAWQ